MLRSTARNLATLAFATLVAAACGPINVNVPAANGSRNDDTKGQEGDGNLGNGGKSPDAPAEPSTIACTEEAKIVCVKTEHGFEQRGVGRTGPSCEFETVEGEVAASFCGAPSGGKPDAASLTYRSTRGSCQLPSENQEYRVSAARLSYRIRFKVACDDQAYDIDVVAEETSGAAAAVEAAYKGIVLAEPQGLKWPDVSDCPTSVSYGTGDESPRRFACPGNGFAPPGAEALETGLVALQTAGDAFRDAHLDQLRADAQAQWTTLQDRPESANAVSGSQLLLPTAGKPTGGCG
jgi:hypothetical protein